jgi:hypothetical protein
MVVGSIGDINCFGSPEKKMTYTQPSCKVSKPLFRFRLHTHHFFSAFNRISNVLIALAPPPPENTLIVILLPLPGCGELAGLALPDGLLPRAS